MPPGPQPNSPVGERADSEVGGGSPEGAVLVNACQVKLRTKKDRAAFADVVAAATVALHVGVELQERAEQAWSDAWDRARRLDEKQGRPYDRHRYARLAHLARVRVLGVCKKPSCREHTKCPTTPATREGGNQPEGHTASATQREEGK